MKTAISLPDELFEQAERLAQRRQTSRSQLYQQAVAEFITRHDPDAVTAAMNRVVEQVGEGPDPFSTVAARRLLERSEW